MKAEKSADVIPFTPVDAYEEVDYGKDEVGPAISERPTVTISSEMADVVDRAEEVLEGSGVYQRAGQLVRVIELPERVARIERARGTAGIGAFSTPSLLDALSRAAKWQHFDARIKKNVPTRPSNWIAEVMAARGTWGFPPLRGVITAPTIKASGEVLDQPGYDEETGLILLHSGRWPRVRLDPKREHAIEALRSLAEVVHDFPFVSGAGRSGAVSAALTLACRTFFDGPVPLFVIGARDAGTGKTRLADAISIIGTGNPAPRITPWSDPDEARKTLMAMAIAGDPVGLLDNWPTNRPLGDEALDGTITSTSVRGRILGRSEMTTAPWDAVLLVTGNNIAYQGDTARRTIPIDLDAGLENPEERTGFLHDPLLPWVSEHRKKLVIACITILRAWHCAGRPTRKLPVMGSFEAWSDTIRQAVVWLDVNDPAETRQELKDASDPNREALRVLLTRWRAVWGDDWKKTSEIQESVNDGKGDDFDELREAIDAMLPPRKSERVTGKQLGSLLRKHHGTVRGGLRLVQSGQKDRDGAFWWRVEKVS